MNFFANNMKRLAAGTNREILRLALPSIVSNITVPLLGLVDVAIVGHMGAASCIGAIAVGGVLFNLVYWNFGFLRMGTSGLTAQARGRGDGEETARVLARALGVAAISSVIILLLQYPVERLALPLLEATGEVGEQAAIYFRVCVWGAPAVLGLYCFKGWFIGMQNSRYPMFIAIAVNVLNIACSLCLVYLFGMKVEGVALGTVIAQYAGLAMATWLWRREYPLPRGVFAPRECFRRREMRLFLVMNRDIFLRTTCLIVVTLFFTAAGTRQGEVVLAVNTLLMQLFTLFSYIMDGFAHAAEALVGRRVGEGNRAGTRRVIRHLFGWGAGLSALFTLLYAVGGSAFLSLLTSSREVTRVAGEYFYWVLAIPFAGFAAFLWDGILIGATATRQMLLAMLIAVGGFFLVYHGIPAGGNHVLWLAFIVYLALRGGMQTLFFGRVERSLFDR
ncbi:MAG: MATE family efflux transporter [Odoribacteraceae bacterium]|jgi:MATE family multidrug resistance protein|nr:MATE family efflux transporter [Odoribacteraceae bacterium]